MGSDSDLPVMQGAIEALTEFDIAHEVRIVSAHRTPDRMVAFANHLPMTIIADSLGAPREDMERFHRWSEAFIVQLGGVSDKAARLEAVGLAPRRARRRSCAGCPSKGVRGKRSPKAPACRAGKR